ncbi:uncharacterized protein LOC114656871 [Erpetoichthys calabaricus]|uniref:uncharacterized protein LOC114656871 n=1 Tax=Erpetoichthys calabaricus TaxID=27687 RepID=UPI00109EF9C2|nr:uncharacterized protein LOC114656871 [Erpetoichthys calabaricus]
MLHLWVTTFTLLLVGICLFAQCDYCLGLLNVLCSLLASFVLKLLLACLLALGILAPFDLLDAYPCFKWMSSEVQKVPVVEQVQKSEKRKHRSPQLTLTTLQRLAETFEVHLSSEVLQEADFEHAEAHTKTLWGVHQLLNKTLLLLPALTLVQLNAGNDQEFWMLTDRFEHIKSYLELRLALLNALLAKLKDFMNSVRDATLWLNEMLALLEVLHCRLRDSSESEVASRILCQQQSIQEEIVDGKRRLDQCTRLFSESQDLLMELHQWFKKFRLHVGTRVQHSSPFWTQVLLSSTTEQLADVHQSFYNIQHLTDCFWVHLHGLPELHQKPRNGVHSLFVWNSPKTSWGR